MKSRRLIVPILDTKTAKENISMFFYGICKIFTGKKDQHIYFTKWKKFVCLPFFCRFLPLEGQKRAKKHPQVDKIAFLSMMQ